MHAPKVEVYSMLRKYIYHIIYSTVTADVSIYLLPWFIVCIVLRELVSLGPRLELLLICKYTCQSLVNNISEAVLLSSCVITYTQLVVVSG